jgi:predicted acylesterase/phospholipase RssA
MANDANGAPHHADSTVAEAYGASQIGPFDYCPKLGFREYWYPAIETRKVRGKPVSLMMLGDDLVLFRDGAGKVVALSDWCPHRGARLSLGVCEFEGTVTCPYHGYVFDGTGQCVAGLIERPDSSFPSKLHARAYPTEERMDTGFLQRSLTLPLRMVGVVRELLENVGEISAVDIASGLASALPAGLYSGKGIERYISEALADPDRTDDFRMLQNELYLVGTDLDTTERIVFGEGEWADVPISLAVAASGALPGIYDPVEVKGREFIDGGIVSTTNVDVAVERGAKFVIVINPLVPYVNDFSKRIPTFTGSRARRVSDMGMAGILNQTFRLLSHDRLHRAVEIWEERYPGVDFILIEPELDDELMFGTSILDYRARLEIAKHGFESVTLKLARDYDRYKSIAERHGIKISARRVRHVLDQVERDEEKLSAWRRVLEQTTGALLRQSGRPAPDADTAEAD